MTDLRHVAQLLHEAGVSDGLGPTAMASWLGRRINEADRDTENEERARRLESDAEAVQVITIHRSKGLEFPIVLCPYMWGSYTPTIKVPVFHDKDNENARTIDVAGEGNAFTVHQQNELVEERGEDLRLLYVALTRAQHQAVLWWVGASDCQHSPLSRLLFDRDEQGVVRSHGSVVPTDDAVETAVTALGSELAVERVGLPSDERWERDAGAPPRLEAAVFDRPLDLGWRRVSYSGITRALHDQPAIGSEPEEPLTSDEELPVVTVRPTPGHTARRRSGCARWPWGWRAMPGGALVGTVVHSVLERTEFDAPDLAAEVGAALEREVTWRNVDLGSVDAVVAGLCAAIESPLGPLVGDVRLRDIASPRPARRAGLRDPAGRRRGARRRPCTSGTVADLLEEHLDPGDPVARYAQRLRDPTLQGVLRGYLTGSLDLVFRLPGDRFVLADYKTNRLSAPDETLTAWHYRPEAVDDEMVAAHYPLQALLYAVALHRYLRWRLPGYDPEQHLGGVLYLFVRGMSATEPTRIGDQPCGVWSWRPPVGLVDVAERALRQRADVVTSVEAPDSFDSSLALRARRAAARVQPSGDPVHVRRARRAAAGAAEREPARSWRGWAQPSRPGPPGWATSASTSRPSGTPPARIRTRRLTSARCPGPTRSSGSRSWPGASSWGRTARSTCRGRPCTSTACGSTSTRWPPTCSSVPRDRPPASTTPCSPRASISSSRSTDDPDFQRLAAATAVLRRVSVIAGGPGTGKTTTVARVLALLEAQAAATGGRQPLIALAAPTGKAAARLEEAVRQEAGAMAVDPGDPGRPVRPRGHDAAPAPGFQPRQPDQVPPRPAEPAAAMTWSSSTRPPWCRSR